MTLSGFIPDLDDYTWWHVCLTKLQVLERRGRNQIIERNGKLYLDDPGLPISLVHVVE